MRDLLMSFPLLLFAFQPAAAEVAADVQGDPRVGQTLTLTISGPEAAETGEPNPFTDYRLDAVFTSPSGERLAVPGYFAADGNAAESGAKAGSAWRLHFVPPAAGEWKYRLQLRQGPGVAMSDDPAAGELQLNSSGSLTIAAAKPGERGMLNYVGSPYLQWAGTGERFLKAGADSPENFLGYAEFDGTYRIGQQKPRRGENFATGLHRYEPHLADWKPGDPTWRQGRGKGIIGALNYLASKGMNSVYMLTMNVGGDGKDVWPWTGHEVRDRFDCSKLDQWNIVFNNMDRLGIQLHIVTQETENDQLLDGGDLGPQRKLYYRELIARFAHHRAVVWNLGEENTNTTEQRKAFCNFISKLDPYDHPIVMHTYPNQYKQYEPLLGLETFDGISLQTDADVSIINRTTIEWLARSRQAGRPWLMCIDEPGSASKGVTHDDAPPKENNQDLMRKQALWGNLMGGGSGVEWYFGYRFPHNDLNLEDWRSRDRLWDYTRHAVTFFHEHLPFWEMQAANALTPNEQDFVFAKSGYVYAVYLPTGGEAKLSLPKATYRVAWYNPRTGGKLLTGTVEQVQGPGEVSLGRPPADKDEDWAILVKLEGEPPAEISPLPEPKFAKPGTPPTVTRFVLVNSETNQDLTPLKDGAILKFSELPTRALAIRAEVDDEARVAVRFNLNSGKITTVERQAPFALGGDTNGNYRPVSLPPGKHQLTAVGERHGAIGKPLTITFTVVAAED